MFTEAERIRAIELYFKAFLVKRVPAPYDFTIENGQATKAEFDDENRATNWHSRLDLLEEHKTHNLKKLFNALSDTQKKCVTREFLSKRLFYSRISFPISYGQKTNDGLVKAFQHLIRLINDKNYENSEPFE